MSDEKAFDSKMFAKYASLKEPDKKLPINVYMWHTSRTLVVFEQYPKSYIHFIMIPRVGAPPRVPANLKDLYTLLTSPEVSKSDAETILREMREDAEEFRPLIEQEMVRLRGFVWPIWMGFKVAPSYKYLHLHIMSDDLTGTSMKKPKHFFSFHPWHGQIYHLDEVLSWFEIVEDRYKDNLRDLRKKYLEIYKRRDVGEDEYRKERPVYDCYYRDDGLECLFEAKDLPTMVRHLEEHLVKRKEVAERRREAREAYAARQANRNARSAEQGKQDDVEHVEEEHASQTSTTTTGTLEDSQNE